MKAQLTPRRSRAPPLYRISRGLGYAAIALTILIVTLVVFTIYSGIQFARGLQQANLDKNTPFTAKFVGSDVLVNTSVSIPNRGYLTATGLTTVLIAYSEEGQQVGEGAASVPSLAAGSTTPVQLGFALNLSTNNSGALGLLTTAQHLLVRGWVNATYGSLFPVSVAFNRTYDWGAPFQQLNMSVGPPYHGPANAPISLPPVSVRLAFTNQAPITVAGSIYAVLYASSQATCGWSNFTFSVPQGQPFDQTVAGVLVAGCSLTGGSIAAVFMGEGFALPLPRIPIP